MGQSVKKRMEFKKKPKNRKSLLKSSKRTTENIKILNKLQKQ